jgi:hypothetical protein
MMLTTEIIRAEQEKELVEGVCKVLNQVAITLAEVEQVIEMLQPKNQILYRYELEHLKHQAQARLVV